MSEAAMVSRPSVSTLGLALVLGVVGCEPPPSVRAVDQWLTAYAQGDVETMVAHTSPADRDWVRTAMRAIDTASVAHILPPRPLSHELLEIEKKAPGRHTVLCRVKTKNPLPYMSERVGQALAIPKVRNRRRRFLSVQGADGQWGVKLDLDRVVARAAFVERFDRRLALRDFSQAEAMLDRVPAPPDEANAQSGRDRLPATLRKRLDEVRRIATSTATSP